MDKYDLGSGLDMGRVEVVQSTDLSQFPELSILNLISMVKEHEINTPWGVRTGGSISSRMLLHEGVLYFGANDHNFYVVDAKSGKELWRFGTNGPNSIWSSAFVWRDRVIFTSYDGNVYCLSLDGKKLHWKFGTNDKLASSPVVYNGIVYFGGKDKNMYALSAETGRLVWKLNVNEEVRYSTIIHDGNLYFTSDRGLYKASLKGKVYWKFPLNGDANERMAIHGDRLYFGCIDKNVYSVTTSGRLVWKFPTNDIIISDTAFHEGRIYIASYDGNVYCIKPDGNLDWKFNAGDMVIAPPFIYKGRIYFSTFNKHLFCITMDGNLVWKLPLDLIIYITIKDDVIYAGGWDCRLYAISTKGKMLWEFHTSMSNQSMIDFELTGDEGFEVVWRAASLGDSGKEKKEEEKFGDYGDFKGSYIQDDMRDYMGGPLDKGGGPGMAYKAGKRVYRK
jgi:outer membrane protein assembly factor BamB